MVNSVIMLNKSTISNKSEDYYEGMGNGKIHNGGRSSLNRSTLSMANGKRMTASALANQLYYSRACGSSSRSGSRRSSFNSDMESVSISDPGGAGRVANGNVLSHCELSQLTNQMAKIQHQLEQQLHNDDKHVRLKQENAVLQERINILEEQILTNEERWRHKLGDEEKKYKGMLARVEREKGLQMDSDNLRHQLLEREHGQCGVERQKRINNMEQLKGKCDRLEEIIADLREQLDHAKQSRTHNDERLCKQKEEAETRLRVVMETCEELRKEADGLHKERGYSSGTASELEQELQRLNEEEKLLRQTNDELNAELLQVSVQHARKLLSDGPSIAKEIDEMSKDQIMNTLRNQEIVNKKLRGYVDGILLRTIEIHPAILEIRPDQTGGLDPPC